MWIVLGYFVLVNGNPALRKIPKIYNALVTTDQNLAPSRAYPVIQPVVHRTAIGYVPPFYYTPINPNYEPTYTTYGNYGNPFPGPESPPQPGPLQNSPVTDNPDAERGEQQESLSSDKNEATTDASVEIENKEIVPDSVEAVDHNVEAVVDSVDTVGENVDTVSDSIDTECKNKQKKIIADKKEKKEQVPLNFYPNYRSMYYDPYFYGYNPYQQVPLAAPGNYFVDYQPRGPIYSGQMPIGQQPFHDDSILSSRNHGINSMASRNHGDKQKSATAITPAQQIPDVPPPPVPSRGYSRT